MVRLTSIIGMHDPGVVEHHVDAAPLVELVHTGLDVLLLGDVAASGVDLAGDVGRHLLDLDQGLGEGGLGDITHEDAGALAQEEDGRLETDTAIVSQFGGS